MIHVEFLFSSEFIYYQQNLNSLWKSCSVYIFFKEIQMSSCEKIESCKDVTEVGVALTIPITAHCEVSLKLQNATEY